MIYLSSFKLSNHTFKNPNIYPYNVFRDKYIEPFSFAPITIFYGNNGCGKSTLLNIIAGKLKIKGKGIKLPNSITKGNMYAVINIITPTKLDRRQKSLLQDLAKTDLEDSVEFKNFKKYLK